MIAAYSTAPSLPVRRETRSLGVAMRVVTMQLCVPVGAAATWTREESARIASEWLLMRSGFRNTVLMIGTTGAEIEVEPELIAFFAAEGGAAVVVSAPIRNASQLAGIEVDAYCARPTTRRPFSVVATPVRYQVPLLFDDDLVVPDQRVDLARLQRRCIQVASGTGRSDCA